MSQRLSATDKMFHDTHDLSVIAVHGATDNLKLSHCTQLGWLSVF